MSDSSLPIVGGGPKANDKVCQALAKTLADAKRGEVQLVGIIAIGEDGRPKVLFGGEADLTPSLYLGTGMLSSTIMQQIITPPKIGRPGEMPAVASEH